MKHRKDSELKIEVELNSNAIVLIIKIYYKITVDYDNETFVSLDRSDLVILLCGASAPSRGKFVRKKHFRLK